MWNANARRRAPGLQFGADYLAWCESEGVHPRFGAVHQHGSITLIERFWLSMKNECFRRQRVPLALPAMQAELRAYLEWYHEHRPHQGLGGVTPHERLSGTRPAREARRLEPREAMPLGRGRERARRVKGRLALCVVREVGGAKLPVVALREAA